MSSLLYVVTIGSTAVTIEPISFTMTASGAALNVSRATRKIAVARSRELSLRLSFFFLRAIYLIIERFRRRDYRFKKSRSAGIGLITW